MGKRKEVGLSAEQQYNLVCKQQMESIHKAIEANAESIKENTDLTKEQGKVLKEVEKKVNNGYGTAIANVNDKLDKEIAENVDAHRELRKMIGGLTKFVAGALVSILVVLISILGSVWLTTMKASREHTHVEKSATTTGEKGDAKVGTDAP